MNIASPSLGFSAQAQGTDAESAPRSSTSSSQASEHRISNEAPRLHIDHSPKLSHPTPSTHHSSPATTPSPPSSPTSYPDPQLHLPKAYRLSRASQWTIFSLILFSFIALATIIDSFLNRQRDLDGCKQSYMRPVFIKQTGFDSEMTRFASKYGLYLYREKDFDRMDQPVGVPVLFIPGHAGSYKQVKSIAAEASHYYYQNYAANPTLREQGMRSLDFFTVDFHEEFSALHGQSLLEQAEYLNDAIDYILKLYPLSRKTGPRMNVKLPDPSSVIVLGHSMGGVVARAMFMLHNYQPGTINTVITMSTPHLLPPAPFDWKISKLYDDMRQFWSEGYLNTLEPGHLRSPASSLKDVTLISVTGGTLDNVVCSDSANVGAFLPPTHGFTVFTSAVPYVWTGTDHLSILTCKQVVRVLAQSMLDILDARRGSQTKPVEERMNILRRIFLGGLQDRVGDGSDIELGRTIISDLSHENSQILDAGERLILEPGSTPKTIFVPKTLDTDAFAILSDLTFGDTDRFDLHLCRPQTLNNKEGKQLLCRDATSITVPLPASTSSDTSPFSGRTFRFAGITYREMGEYDWLAVTDRGGETGFLIVEAYNMTENTITVDQSMFAIAKAGVHVEIMPSLFSTVQIPAIENPMLAYRMRVSQPLCQARDTLFSPFLRQSITTMHESKFYVNLAGNQDETEVAIHGRTAFWSQDVRSQDADHRGMSLQVWMDPTCNHPMTIDLSVDWYGSAGRIGFRNGTMLASYAFIVILLVVAAQIQCFNKTGVYPHFGHGLSYCIRYTWPIVIPLLGLSSIYQCMGKGTYSLKDTLNFEVSIARHDVLAGNTDPFFWWLPVVGLTISIGVICFLWVIVEVMLHIFATIFVYLGRYQSWSWRVLSRASETPGQRFQRRATTTLVLFVLVATCIPYQFVFVVAFLVHIINCIRSLRKMWISPSQDYKNANRYHYMQSILMLLITLLPFNVPILVVWIRNLSVHWFVPFSSDHNVFAVAPIMLYVELLSGGRKMLPRTSQIWSGITYTLLYGIVVYAFLYGMKYTHSLYFLFNYLVAWFLVLYGRESHYGRMVYCYVTDHLYPFRNKKHS